MKGVKSRQRKKRHSGVLSDADRELLETHLAQNPPPKKNVVVKKNPTRSQANLATLVRQGRVPIDATVDLHGKTLESAWRGVDAAIARLQRTHGLILRVITGKGFRAPGGVGVLATEIPDRLRRDERVAEILQAVTAKDGGQGAWFVKLRI